MASTHNKDSQRRACIRAADLKNGGPRLLLQNATGKNKEGRPKPPLFSPNQRRILVLSNLHFGKSKISDAAMAKVYSAIDSINTSARIRAN